LDPRTLGTLNNTVKLLLDLRHWTDPEVLPAERCLDYPDDSDEEEEDEEQNDNESDEETEKSVSQLQELAQEIQSDIQKREGPPPQEQQPTWEPPTESQDPRTSSTDLENSEVNPSNPKSEIQPDPKPKSRISIMSVPKF